MRFRDRRLTKFAVGAGCWLTAAALTFGPAMNRALALGDGDTWKIDLPLPNTQYMTWSNVSGAGSGAASTNYAFQIREHGNGPVYGETTGTTSPSGTWGSSSVQSPSGGWPVGLANATVAAEGSVQTYVTIEFKSYGG